MNLPPHHFIDSPSAWESCLSDLKQATRLAVDLEANSMYAYQERVCLIQISTAVTDYIIDPESSLDLRALGALIAKPSVEKIFHAAEYDLMLMKRTFGWELNNLFDTMWAARILGYRRYGLASLLERLYDITLDKRYQKSNWCKRPLSTSQLTYAQLDTHYLLRLRDDLADQLDAAGRSREAQEIFAEQTRVKLPDTNFHPDDFWSINGVHDMSGAQQAVLKALAVYRDEEARRRDKPLFKVFGQRTLVELAEKMPENHKQLHDVYGMSSGQVRRYGSKLLRLITNARQEPPPEPPKRPKRPSDRVLYLYDRLHTWRKKRAQARGVESDVVISKDALWAIARQEPQTLQALAAIEYVGQWRSQQYGQEILDILRNAG